MTAAAPAGVDSGAGDAEIFPADGPGADPAARARADEHTRQLQDVARLLASAARYLVPVDEQGPTSEGRRALIEAARMEQAAFAAPLPRYTPPDLADNRPASSAQLYARRAVAAQIGENVGWGFKR